MGRTKYDVTFIRKWIVEVGEARYRQKMVVPVEGLGNGEHNLRIIEPKRIADSQNLWHEAV